jgi:hypothetical protein
MLVPFTGASALFAATIINFEEIAAYSALLLISWISVSLTTIFLTIIYGSETTTARKSQARLWAKCLKIREQEKLNAKCKKRKKC